MLGELPPLQGFAIPFILYTISDGKLAARRNGTIENSRAAKLRGIHEWSHNVYLPFRGDVAGTLMARTDEYGRAR
jgi:hypothetical protein